MSKTIFSFLFLAGILFPAFSETIELSVDRAVSISLEKNLGIRQESISLNAQKRASALSWNSIGPSASASGSWSRDLPEKRDSKATVSAELSASVNLTPNLISSIRGAVKSYEQQQISYESARRTLELNVRKSYYSILSEKANLEIQEKSLRTSQNQYESNLAKYRRGTLSNLDVLNSKLQYQNARMDVDNLRTSFEESILSFKQVLGIPLDTEISFSDSLDAILSRDNVSFGNLVAESDEIRLLKKKIEVAKNSVLASRLSAYGPSLSASWKYSWSSSDDGENWNDGGRLTLGAKIPLDGVIPWSQTFQNILSAQDSVRKLELELEQAETSLEIKVQNCRNRINRCYSNISQRKDSVSLAEQTYSMTSDSYNHGTKDLLALQSALDSLNVSRVNLLNEAYNFICAVLDLENVIGVEFGTL